MASDYPSETAHTFVQMSQLALGTCVLTDESASSTALVSLLRNGRLVARHTEVDAVMVFRALLGVAAGFFRATHTVGLAVPMSSARLRCNIVLAAVRRHYTDSDLRLGSFASRLTCCESSLSRALVRETGVGFPDHLNSIRVLAAIGRLSPPPLCMKEVAYDVGYLRTSELDRQFRRRLGVTPGFVLRLMQQPLASSGVGLVAQLMWVVGTVTAQAA